MKKRCAILFSFVVMMVLCAMTFASPVCAANRSAKVSSDLPYKYKLMVYAGQEGHFTKANGGTLENGGKVWYKTYDMGAGEQITAAKLGFKLDNDKYYVRGFRIAGHDNDETNPYGTTGFQTVDFSSANQDVSYELAYGIKGGMVAYTVNYVDADGKKLLDPDTFYGMAGDKPVVSYLYYEGYLPDNYNIAKTLSKDESKNVFTFTYHKATAEEQQQQQQQQQTRPQAPGTAANPAGTNTAGNNAAAANGNAANGNAANGNAADGNTATIGDNSTPLANAPNQYADLDGNDVPLADGEDTGGSHLPIIIGSAIAVLILAAIAAYLIKRRREDENV